MKKHTSDGRSHWLKVDIDRRLRLPSELRFRRLLERAGYDVREIVTARSPGGRGWHVQIRVRPLPSSCCEMVALQAILGSDPGRESVNLLRARHVDSGKVPPWWRSRWNVLYA